MRSKLAIPYYLSSLLLIIENDSRSVQLKHLTSNSTAASYEKEPPRVVVRRTDPLTVPVQIDANGARKLFNGSVRG